MIKAILVICVAIAIGAVIYVVLFQNQNETMSPIVDPQCEAGYTLVGEGCMTLQEACELQGDNYYYDISEEKCLPR